MGEPLRCKSEEILRGIVESLPDDAGSAESIDAAIRFIAGVIRVSPVGRQLDVNRLYCGLCERFSEVMYEESRRSQEKN